MRAPTLLLQIFLLSLAVAPFAFQSDELLIEDEDFGLGFADPAAASQPVSPPTTTRRPSADTGLDSDSKIQFTFDHAFGDLDFYPAGTFSARLKPVSQGGQILTKLRFKRGNFSQTEQDNFKQLLEDDDFYRIRLPSNVLNQRGREYIISSVKARCLAQDTLDELLVLHMEGVNILSVSYGPPGLCQYNQHIKLPRNWSFKSHTFLKYGDMAPRSPVFTEAAAEEKGDHEAAVPIEKPFWAKYWMYLIPLALIVMNAVTQAMNMPEEQAQTAAAGRGQATAARRR